MSKLDEVIGKKLDEIDEMSVTDDGFKEATQAVSSLIDAQTKSESKESKLGKIGKWALALIAAASPFVLNAMNNRKDDERLNTVLEYEKTGAVMSTGGKSVLSKVLKFKH